MRKVFKEVMIMCYNCGCGLPDDDMGNEKNITNKTFDELAQINGTSSKEQMVHVRDLINQVLEDDQNNAA